MLKANLYVDRIEIAPYLTPEECQGMGGPDCIQVAARLKNGSLAPEDCLTLSPAKRYALSLAVRALEVLPVVQSLELPRPVPPDLYEINEPGPEAPLLVTGNSEFTLSVVTGLLAYTVSPFYLLLVDTRGDTVDMSMIYRSFTPQRLDQGLEHHRLADRLKRRQLIIPGVVGPLKDELASYTGWDIRVGPICVAELPLFLGEAHWQPPAKP
jgi:CO dehydrogenase/acetyl-CoA synthase gamma subunit (corrinoid Fe-S protein)